MVEQSSNIKLCMQDLTLAPVDTLKTGTADKEEIWNKIIEATKNQKPVLGQTGSSEKINWNAINLTSKHYYTVIDAGVLIHKLGSEFKVLKLRNAFKAEEYKGEGSASDTLFWDQVEASEEKSRLLSSVGSKEGVIYMLFSDYLKYFDSTYVNHF